jgi:hypothetical protein
VKSGHVDDETPHGTGSTDSPPTRTGPLPVDGDTWDADGVWRNGDPPMYESDRYHGRRRTKGAVADYRWWIGGAAALIASIATVALIMAPSAGGGGSISAPLPGLETGARSSTIESGELPTGGGSAPVDAPTTAGNLTAPTVNQSPFAVTIEAESGSPTVILAGSAASQPDAQASGGQIVTGLGNLGAGAEPGTMQVGGLSLPSAGTYLISIYFANLGDHSQTHAVLTVTGAEPKTVMFAGSKKCCGVRSVDMPLSSGVHVITITNPTGPAPSIDKIVIRRL